MEEKLVFPDVVEKSVLWGTMPKAKMADRYKAIAYLVMSEACAPFFFFSLWGMVWGRPTQAK